MNLPEPESHPEPGSHPEPVTNRRDLLRTSAVALGAVGLSACSSADERSPATHRQGRWRRSVRSGDTVLFQGDSITDAGRSRETEGEPNLQSTLGGGYAWLAGSTLLAAGGVGAWEDAPRDLRVFNRGVSGNKVHQLAERWDADCIELRPDVVSILIGVNDIWHGLAGDYDGTVEVYERDYDALLARTRAALPDVRLILCEPFVLRCGAVNDDWFPEFDRYRAAAKRMADKHATAWVPFQSMFDEAVRYAPAEQFAKDGVHPTSVGAALMAQAWMRVANGG